MHNDYAQAAKRGQGEPPEGVQRLELLIRHFSPAEIQCLSLLQLLLRQRPSALDFPLEESRLQFARWLVEHGRMSEDLGTSLEGQPSAEEASDALRPQGGAPEPSRAISSGAQLREPPIDTARRTGGERWHRKLFRAWCKVRRSITKIADFGHELGRTDYLPGEGRSWGMNGTEGPNCSHGPGGVARSNSNAPWLWARFRHDG